MGSPHEAIGGLMIAVASGLVMSIAALLIMYKTIDGDIPAWMGLGALAGVVGVLALTAKPPHPAIPGIVLVVAITLMAFFPFMLNQLDRADLNSFDVHRLERAFQALVVRPENFACKLEVAKALHSQGFVHQAIAIATETLNTIPNEKDQVTNRSIRDQFRDEDYKVKQWMRAAGKTPLYAIHMRCGKCGHENPVNAIVCQKCAHPHLLDVAKKGDNRTKVIGKLVLSWGLLALLIVGSASVGLAMPGAVGYGLIALFIVAIGLLFAWMFRKPGT